MKFFVTGVGGQLGHDVMNELIKRGHEGVGSDIQEQYSGVEDGSEVTKASYLSLDITDKEAVDSRPFHALSAPWSIPLFSYWRPRSALCSVSARLPTAW